MYWFTGNTATTYLALCIGPPTANLLADFVQLVYTGLGTHRWVVKSFGNVSTKCLLVIMQPHRWRNTETVLYFEFSGNPVGGVLNTLPVRGGGHSIHCQSGGGGGGHSIHCQSGGGHSIHCQSGGGGHSIHCQWTILETISTL